MKKGKFTAFDGINYFFMAILIVIMVYPFWYVLMVSLNDNSVANYSKIVIVPQAITFENYQTVLADQAIMKGYMITIARTLLGTFLGVLCNAMFAYGLHVKYLIFRKFFVKVMVFTMFFSGGIIPWYILLNKMGLTNSFLVYILPSLMGSWNVIMMRTYYTSTIPTGLEEAARIDGANELSTFFRVILPLSKPMLATMALFMAVGHWNDWWTGEILVNNQKLWPVQNVLRRMISSTAATEAILKLRSSTPGSMQAVTTESVRMAAVIVTTLPILVVYPFCQKYFVKGVMIGSIKE